jgi:nucleoside-diphosphate-sugar epimerase
MRVFVTGATGFIGTQVVGDLQAAGHDVVGVARSDAGADALARAGVEVWRGDLSDPQGLAEGARTSDGVIHLAFIHDFANFANSVEVDRVAVLALIAALEGSDKPLVIASGTLMVSHVSPATEDALPASPDAPRAAVELALMAARGVRGSVVRLAPMVHDRSRGGLLNQLIPLARQKGVSAYLGDGANRWPATHVTDAARLFRLALERAPPGSRLHAAAESGIPLKAIAEAIGEGLGVPVRSLPADEAFAHFGTAALFVGRDNLTSSDLTRQRLGWRPEGPDLMTDLREGQFFAAPVTAGP